MSKINVEEKNGIACRYIEAQDGIRVYLLPNVPMDAGEIEVQEDFNETTINEFMDKIGFSSDQREKVKKIVAVYRGRQMDTLSVLGYAQEQEKFDEFAQRLEERYREDFRTIHPDLMYSRTDVTAFFMGLYAALEKAPHEDATKARELAENYGPGIVVLPKKK